MEVILKMVVVVPLMFFNETSKIDFGKNGKPIKLDQPVPFLMLGWWLSSARQKLSQLKSHVTPYKFNSSHWLKLQHSDWKANLVKDFFLTNNFSTNESTLIYKGSHDF